MTTVYFARHGHVYNPNSVFYGRMPGFPISEEGREAAAYLGQQLKADKVVKIYHSPMLRAVQTAEEIQKQLDVPMQEDGRLSEVETGLDGRVHHAPLVYPESPRDGAESIGEIYQRMGSFLRDILKRHKDAFVVVVSHGGPIRILEMGLLGEPMNEHGYRLKPVLNCATALKITEENNQFAVSRLND